MAAEWIKTTVGDFCPFIYGKGLPAEKRINGNIPVVSSAGISGSHDQALVPTKGIVIGRKGTVGSVTYCEKPFWPIDTTFYVVDEPMKRDVRFTYYLLKTIGLETMNSDSAVPGLNRDNAHAVQVKVPPLSEQKRISSILGALDDKIELNRRMNAKLEDVARTLFKSWFVDFDPVRTKLDGRPPAGMDAATAALFPDAFVESALGLMPRGWQATTIGSSIGFLSGFAFKSQDWQGEGIPVVKIGSVKPGLIDLDQVSYVSAMIAKQAARYRLRAGDLLIGMTGYVGEVGLVPPSANPPLLNQRVGKFVLEIPGTESLAFWYCITTQPAFNAYVESQSHGTAQANVSGEAIMSFPHLMPPNEIVRAFNLRCRSTFDRLLLNYGESRALKELRDLKFTKLFGEANSVDMGLR